MGFDLDFTVAAGSTSSNGTQTFSVQVVLGHSLVDTGSWSQNTFVGSLVIPSSSAAPVTARVNFDGPSRTCVDGVVRPGFNAVGGSNHCSVAEPLYIRIGGNEALSNHLYILGLRFAFTPCIQSRIPFHPDCSQQHHSLNESGLQPSFVVVVVPYIHAPPFFMSTHFLHHFHFKNRPPPFCLVCKQKEGKAYSP